MAGTEARAGGVVHAGRQRHQPRFETAVQLDLVGSSYRASSCVRDPSLRPLVHALVFGGAQGCTDRNTERLAMLGTGDMLDVEWASMSQVRDTTVAWLGLAWPGLAWLGLAWPGLAWLGLAWPGLT